ncbi:hypothetical protein K5V21_15415 [Clostridium sardiniense]|uniref:Uncharacterized protein n=1 Tax=Clostridium sardiniense TaxID=29369 RepID=A0ABS7L1Y6_CLOSR|nr:hypothetical protein [Clostridium sardiniense]MBY0756832.1 hypothetical protein [Clostridium sardiniense]MDQ0458675.1 hypothetical protein [Clostridium sardiniense]
MNTSSNNTCDDEFRINHNSIKEGKLEWEPRTGKGTNKNREEALILKNRYYSYLQEYSNKNNIMFLIKHWS